MCDFSIPQNKTRQPISRLPLIVKAIGHTVMLLDPWDDPWTLKRIWCLWEVLQTDEAVRLARAELRTYGDEQMAAEKLIHAALARRVDDNVSAVVVRLFSSQEPIGPRSPIGNSAFRRSSFVHLPTPSSFVRVVGGFEDR